ncbi:PXMP2/4 family protein 4 [Smittium mucronatum]|uniref:PXMP2/4 family protein 4 n=1 Tax=Smittium mucronatum TaxID=133383 RepID=A0A1R0H4N4_9FUNG|nr:PXMP2/4 family protein 4 [Smittium mucronatum]
MSFVFNFWRRSAEKRPYTTLACTELVLASLGDILAQNIDARYFRKAASSVPETSNREIFGSSSSSNGGDIATSETLKAKEPFREPESIGSKSESWYDYQRTLQFALCAASLSPLGFRWHKYLDKRFPLKGSSKADRPIVSIFGFRAKIPSFARPVAKRVVFDQVFYEPLSYTLLFSQLSFLEGLGVEDTVAKLKNVALPAYMTGLFLWPFIQFVNFAFVPLVFRVSFTSVFDIFWDTYLSWANSNSKGASSSHGPSSPILDSCDQDSSQPPSQISLLNEVLKI